MPLIRNVLTAVFALSPVLTFAGPGGTTCATAEPIFAGATFTGDTSAAGYGNPVGAIGPLPSPANDAIYSVVGSGTPENGVPFTGQYAWAFYLTTTCAGTAAPPLEAVSGAAGSSGVLQLDNGSGGSLTAGQTYFLIVSGDPSQPASSNGAFTFSVPPTPVNLQSFSIE